MADQDVEKVVYLIKSDPNKNNNKFWKGTVYKSSGDVLCEWGRVGDKGQSKLFPGAGVSFLDKKANEKKKDGRNGEIAYREIDIVGAPTESAPKVTVAAANLSVIAKKQIQTTSTEVAKLIDYLVKENIHDIVKATNGGVTYNYDAGVFQTPMGLVSQATIDQARNKLSDISDYVVSSKHNNSEMVELTRDYLMLIPTNIGRNKLDLSEFWKDTSKVKAQNDILDGLQASLAQAQKPIASATGGVVEQEEKVFDTSLEPITDKKKLDKLNSYYYDTRHTMHSCYHYTPIALWDVEIKSMKAAFEKDGAKMPCIVMGFHGSGVANMISLLKSGMLVRPPSKAAIAGALFGSGIYCAPIFREDKTMIKGAATKALGYSTGYWTGSAGKRTFMFIVEMAMGKYYIPHASTYMSTKYPVQGHDSTWAYGGHSGVKNDEAIVYRASQVNIKHLMELKG